MPSRRVMDPETKVKLLRFRASESVPKDMRKGPGKDQSGQIKTKRNKNKQKNTNKTNKTSRQ